MNDILERYLYIDSDAYYLSYDGIEYAQSVHGKSFLRYKKAKEQAEKNVIPVEKIIEIVNNFLSEIGINLSDNPIVNDPLNINYKQIQERNHLESQKDIVWIKFTIDGYIGVVATSDDINFDLPNDKSDYDRKHKVYNSYTRKYEDKWMYNTSGIIVHKLNKSWDESFVLVFPLDNIPNGYSRGDIEHAIGNLLLENDVPILDVFSHLY